MVEKLTPQQLEAVTNRGGRLLVSAAAGSGKTKVLVDRLLGYVMDPHDPANLDDFLIITYTKAAATELRGKIAAKLTEHIARDPENKHLQRQMQRLFLAKISTVHGFCADVLREFAYRLDLSSDFRVADENECREIRETTLSEVLDRAYETTAEDGDFRAFVDTQGLGRDDRLVADIVLKVHDSARCHLFPEQWLQNSIGATDFSQITDAAQTRWGRCLMEDLFSYLDDQLAVMTNCARMASEAEGMDKPAAILWDTVHQLEHLRQADSWDQVIARKGIDYGRLSFPRKGIDEDLKEQIKACREACKKGLEKHLRSFADPSELVLKDLEQSCAAARGLVSLVKKFSDAYTAAKNSRRVLDFGDLEHKMLDLLLGTGRSGATVAAREIASRFREIMVDEYQDSNSVQDAIFDVLTRERSNCFMVGDVKQSIYQFRLADPQIFLEKYQSYAPAEQARPGEGRKVLLSANFRSGGEVIQGVNDVFTDCMSARVGGLTYGSEEMLREGVPHNPIPDTAVELYGIDVREDTYQEETAFVADRIARMLAEKQLIRDGDGFRPIREEDIVILLRSPGSVGAAFQQALEVRGIRCATGGGMDLLQTEEIGTLRSILQTVSNPRQDIPLISTLASPVFGFTADDLAAFRSKRKYGTVYDALKNDDSPKTKQFLETLEILRADARMHPIARLIQRIFELTRMDSIYASMDSGSVRESNLQAFYTLAADYEATSRRELSQFLEYLDSMEDQGLVVPAEGSAGAVTIMSIHKSKGLEFPVVFLCGLSRQFNRESLRAQVLCHKELGLGLSVADRVNRIRYPAISKRAIAERTWAESISEEMRVLYVALTRARDRLIMTYAQKNLEAHLRDTVLRLNMGSKDILCRDVVCPGEWVILSALYRMEAGQFHAAAGSPGDLRISEYPWKIILTQAPEAVDTAEAAEEITDTLPEDTAAKLKKSLAFVYPHGAATKAPSKQTATQRKDRPKDQEAAEGTEQKIQPLHRSWRAPSFAGKDTRGVTYGNAMHAVMQYISYDACGNAESVRAEINRLVEGRFISEEYGAIADEQAVARFFATPEGAKLRSGTPFIREFKFSILDSGDHYGADLQEEWVLLQGVVDCALLESDGITVLDFKTDSATEDTLPQLTERYGPQIKTYAQALERIYKRPIKACRLYFFSMDRFVDV